MVHELHFPILKELGLSENEALIYEILLESGTISGGDLAKKTDIGRGNVYNLLSSLHTRGLVQPIEGKKTLYQAVDPSRLQGLLDKKMLETQRISAEFAQALPRLSSAFNLSTGKPAVQIFEGLDGAKTALWDSLSSKTEILTYLDIRAVKGPLAKINTEYVRKRIAANIPKRIIVADTPEARAFFAQQNTPLTVVAFVKGFPERHEAAMEAYDGTVSYVTLTETKCISMLIKDANIYAMHRAQFEFLGSRATEVVDYAAARTDEAGTAGSKAA